MKNFNQFAEAVMITTAKPESDSVGAVDGFECPCNQAQDDQPVDMFSQSADDVLNNLGDVVQPDDGIGETGEIESGSEDSSGVEIECTDAGMWIKFGDFEMIIPKHVAQAIKKHVMERMVEKMTEEGEESETEETAEEHEAGESEETEEKEEHAFEETPAEEEAEEHEASETEEEEEDEEVEDDETKKESVRLDLARGGKHIEKDKAKKKMCKKCAKTEKSN